MSKTTRRSSFKGRDREGEECEYHLRKWSATKLIVNLKRFGDVIKGTVREMGADDRLTQASFVANLVVSMGEYAESLTELVAADLIGPKLSPEEVGDLDPEDFLGLVEEIFRLNMTEGLKKRFLGLMRTVLPAQITEGLSEESDQDAGDEPRQEGKTNREEGRPSGPPLSETPPEGAEVIQAKA